MNNQIAMFQFITIEQMHEFAFIILLSACAVATQ